MINSFIYSNFNCGSLIGHFKTHTGIKKVEKIQERSLKLILIMIKHIATQLLEISKKPSMEIIRLWMLITEISKALNESKINFFIENYA